jgi:hypothetical protein
MKRRSTHAQVARATPAPLQNISNFKPARFKHVRAVAHNVSLERATADAQTIRAAARQCLKRVSIVSSVFSVCGRQNFSVRLWNITTGRGRVCAMKRATGPAVFRSSISSEDP